MAFDIERVGFVRANERHLVDLAGVAIFGIGSTSVRVLDLSLGGAKVSLPLPYATYGNDILLLRIPNLIRAAVVPRWSADRIVGVEFRIPESVQVTLGNFFKTNGLG